MISEREGYGIQVKAKEVAERRVDRTQAFLDLGRAKVSTRDVNEAQSDLLRAQNAATAALIDYRLSELELQRDMGLLNVNEKGLYNEFNPEDAEQN